MSALFDTLYAFGARLANIGVYDDLDFNEKKKIQVLNLCVFCGIVPKLYFATQNLLQDKYLLSGFNLLHLSGGIAILLLHHYRKLIAARMLVIVVGSLMFTASAILYRNGGEYYLMVNLIIVIIFFNDTRYLVGTGLLCCSLFIGIKIFHYKSDFVYDTVPENRMLFNIAWSSILLTLALWFFKTEQLSYVKEIEHKNEELEKTNQTKEKLFSIIAHDLRSPIGQLKGSLELVNREYMTLEKFSEIAGKLSHQVDQLHNTLDNLLRWSLSQLQGITAHPEKTELSTILTDKLTILGQKLDEKNIKLIMSGIDRSIWVDPDHLLLVLRNILSNAIKYSHPGSNITIETKSNATEVTIVIRDNGIGMSEEIRRAIFDAEILASKPGTANEKGTGLGLKLCKEFIEKNNGRLYVESELDKGSCFFVSLPSAN